MDELTPGQLRELEEALLALRAELEALDRGLEDGTRPVEPDSAIGRISRMDAMQVQQMAQANRRTARQRLQQVSAALQRVAADEYGECAECGDDIGYPRLKARPEAPFCLSCQSRRERSA
jgi:DnaK suppressor protein